MADKKFKLASKLPFFSKAAFVSADRKNLSWENLIPSHSSQKAASVLFLFLDDQRDKALKLVLTIRSNKLPTHKGQISFAGGHRNLSLDAHPEDTALREAEEELGITGDKIEILGRLRPVKGIDGQLIFPIVGYYKGTETDFQASDEVEKIIFPHSTQAAQAVASEFNFVLLGKSRKSKLFVMNQNEVWGLTAGIIFDAGLEF